MKEVLRRIIKTLFYVALSVFLVFQYLNHSGFCYDERRYLTKDEIIDRVVNLYFKAREKNKNLYQNNPYCCELRDKPEFVSYPDIFISAVFGYYFYEVDIYYKKSHIINPKESHEMTGIVVNSCATKIIDTYGINLFDKEYQSNIERIKNYQLKK